MPDTTFKHGRNYSLSQLGINAQSMRQKRSQVAAADRNVMHDVASTNDGVKRYKADFWAIAPTLLLMLLALARLLFLLLLLPPYY